MSSTQAKDGMRYQHDDGRICSWIDSRWMHFDHADGEPTPRERKSYSCMRNHPNPSDHEPERGLFGFPGAGVRAMIGELQSYQYPPDRSDVKIERVCDIMDEAQSLYRRKAAGYKGVEGDLADHLGVKGQFVDINRKFWRMKAMLWDEVVPKYPEPGAGENVEEVLMDFIGHAALTIDFLRREREKGDDA